MTHNRHDQYRPLDADYMLHNPPAPTRIEWSARDTVLYNLGVGIGAAAVEDEALLPYVLEEAPLTIPTMTSVLGMVPMNGYGEKSGVLLEGALHGEESVEMLRPLPAAGALISTPRIAGVWDKGADRGAIIAVERTLTIPDSNDVIARVRSILMLRNNGGFNGSSEGSPRMEAMPDGKPDGHFDIPTRPEQALIYRLSGDLNPLHSHPEAAIRVGFPKPILMGLCSFAVAAHGVAQVFTGGDFSRIRTHKVRFTGVVYPGETLRLEYWRQDDGSARFRVRVLERDIIAMNDGRSSFVPA
jgi:acyl dehydratase